MVKPTSHNLRRTHSTFAVKRPRDGTLALVGDLDMATAPKLARALRAAAPGDLTIDMSRLAFCGCAGLAELVADCQRRNAVGAQVTLVHVTAALHRLLILTAVIGEFVIELEPDLGAIVAQPDGSTPLDHQRLQRAIADRAAIEQAVGILMAANGVGAEPALHLLADRARQDGSTLQRVAAAIAREQEPETTPESTLVTPTAAAARK